MKKYVFILCLAAVILFAACGQNQDTPAQTTEPELIQDETFHQEPELMQDETSNQEPQYEDMDTTPTTTVRFYYHCAEIDPDAFMSREAFLYVTEEITAVEGFTADFRRLMYEHTGLQILDLWFEDSKLYVDLHESAIGFFNHHGTTGGMRNTIIFENSLLSISGVSSFEVLVNGQRGVQRNHFDFAHVAIVENGVVVRREFFDVPDVEANAPEIVPTMAAWQEAYGELLRYYYANVPLSDEWLDWHFFLHDVDKDGVPEIFIAYIAAGIWVESIYTFAHGGVMPIEGSFFAYWGIWSPINRVGIVINAYGLYNLMVIQDGALVTEIAFRRPFFPDDEQEWLINSVGVTEDEFMEMFMSIMPVWVLDGGYIGERTNIFPHVISEVNIREIVFGK